MREGDYVRYFPVKGNLQNFKDGYVLDFYPDGIPSFKKPMVKIRGVSGLVDAAHCTVIQGA